MEKTAAMGFLERAHSSDGPQTIAGSIASTAHHQHPRPLAIEDHHPSQHNYVPVLTLQRSCREPCPQGQYRCLADDTCWARFGTYCRLCKQRDKQVCACETAQGPLEDGASCQYMISGDLVTSGSCQHGVCSPKK